MTAEGAGPLVGARLGMGGDVPDRLHRHGVHLAHLGEGDPVVRPAFGPDRLAVDPVGGIGVPAHLHVFLQLLVAHRAALRQQGLDLPQDEGVAFDGGGVVGLLEPDAAPDVAGLEAVREAAHALPQLADLDVEPLVYRSPCRTPATRHARLREVVELGADPNVPHNSAKCALGHDPNAPHTSERASAYTSRNSPSTVPAASPSPSPSAASAPAAPGGGPSPSPP